MHLTLFAPKMAGLVVIQLDRFNCITFDSFSLSFTYEIAPKVVQLTLFAPTMHEREKKEIKLVCSIL